MELQVQHSVHPEHPLILVDLSDSEIRGLIQMQKKTNREKVKSERSSFEKEDEDEDSIYCNLCGNVMLGSAYSCIGCGFHLHKLCAKLPMEMMHQDHGTEHCLTLVRVEDELYLECDVCKRRMHGGFSYSCRPCDFDVHVRCGSAAQVITHKGHPPHPLHPFLWTALFRCHACGSQHSAGISCRCSTCGFWVHEDCATLPATVKYHHHSHPISIHVLGWYSYIYGKRCNICGKTTDVDWMYWCHGCEHKVHANCLATTLFAERNKTYEVDGDIDLTKLFLLPESFDYDVLVSQMMKHMITHYGSENTEVCSEEVAPLSHFGHKHPLTLCDVQSDNELLYDSAGEEKNKEGLICNACLLPISTPSQVYYSCTMCSNNNYVLHEWCAKLPNELKHPIHPHPLVLLEPDHQKNGFTECWTCESYRDGFVYNCNDCLRFAMDAKCLFPPAISHKAHQHPLKFLADCFNEGCVACPRQCYELAYGCEKCCFYLHNSCALQPSTIKHRYDKHHPFVLMQPPIEDGPEEYVCEFCEGDINPKWWFYHCLPCDLSACPDCIFKKTRKIYIELQPTHPSMIHDLFKFVLVDPTNKKWSGFDASIKERQDKYVCGYCVSDIDPKQWFYHCLPSDESFCANCLFKERSGKFYDRNLLTFVQVDHTDKSCLCSTSHRSFSGVEYALQCAECDTKFHDATCITIFQNGVDPLVLPEQPS